MRTLILAFVVASLSWPAPSDVPAGAPVDVSDAALTTRNGVVLRGGAPFTGTVVERDGRGSVRTLISYADGLRHGAMLSWQAGGTLDAVRPYRHGEKDGRHVGYWPSGARRFDETFVDGRAEGESFTWFESGRLRSVHRFSAGEESGLQQQWEEDGSVRGSYEMRNGRRYGRLGAMPCLTVRAAAQ